MLPSKGYFKGVKCPDQSKGGCQRPFCHFRHEIRPEADSTAGTSSASVNENTEQKSRANINQRPTDVHEKAASTASSGSSDLVSSRRTEVESKSSKVADSEVNKSSRTMAAIKPEMIQQLVNAAVHKVIAENPALAAGTVDTATIMQSIDTSAIVAQATQSLVAAKSMTQTEPANNDDTIDSAKADQIAKPKKKLYLRPPNAPAYNPTPIKELEKRKLMIEDNDDSSPNLTPIRNRLLDDVIESESNSKGSGVESELTDFSASSEDEEDREKIRSEFDILEEVLAEHSANNKNKVKKKKKKALGKLQYSNSPTKFIDESSLISDARDIGEGDFSIDIDRTPKRKTKQITSDKTDEPESTPYFLPPSPVFTGASCDGYSNSGTVYTDPYSSKNTLDTNFNKFYDKGDKSESENDESNQNASNSKNDSSSNLSNDTLPISAQSKEKEKPRKGHALLCQLVQNPIPVTKLSRQNVSAWLPGAKKSTAIEETESPSGDLLEAMVSHFDGASQTPVLSKGKEPLEQSSKEDDLISSKLAGTKSYKVDLSKEIQSLNKNKGDDKADKVQETDNQNSNTSDSSNKSKSQEEILNSNAKKQSVGSDDDSGSESERLVIEDNDGEKKVESDENENDMRKKSPDKEEKLRGKSESEIDEESDASSRKGKKKYKKKKRSKKNSESEEESSDDEDSNLVTSEINEKEKNVSRSKDKSKENKLHDSSLDSNDEANNKKNKEGSESNSEGENHEIKKSDKKIKSGEYVDKKERNKKKQKKKKHRKHTDSENSEESDASAEKEKRKHKKKKKRRSHKKSDSDEENSDEGSSDEDQEKKSRKKKKKRKKRKSYDTDESEANTDKESTDKKFKSKSKEGKKEKDKEVKEKDEKSHSDSEKDDEKKELDNKTKSSKIQEKERNRRSRSRDKKSEDRHTDAKNEAKDGLEKRDKGKSVEKEFKKRKRSSSSERSSSRHRSSSRKRKKRRQGSKYKKKRGRKHKKRKYSRSDSEESNDDDESDEESDSSEEKENKSKEKGKRHKTSKHHKRSSKNKKKGRYRRSRSRSSSESSSRSRSRSRSHSKSKDKKRKDRQSKEEKKKSSEISIPMPVDPSKIKEEKIDCVDLTKVKLEKLDDETMNLEINIKKTNSVRMELPCSKVIKEEKTSDNEGEKQTIDQENEQTNQISIAKKSTNEGIPKTNEPKTLGVVDPVISKSVLDKGEDCPKKIAKSLDVRRDSGDQQKEVNKDNKKSYSKSKNNDIDESNKSKEKLVKESESPISNKHKVDLNKEIEKLSSKPTISVNQTSEMDSNKNSKDSDKSAPMESDKPAAPPSLSMFDMVLASTTAAATPSKKVLKEVSIFDAVAASNNDFPSPQSSPDHSPAMSPVRSPRHSPGHLPDSPSFDYNSKFTDPPGTFNFDGIKRRKSSCDEKETSKEKKKEKDDHKLKDKKEGNRKEEHNKESRKSKNEHAKDTKSTEKEKQSKSKDDHHKEHKSSSSSKSHRSSKEESKHSSSRSSSKHKETSHSKSSSSSSHTKKKEESKSHSSSSSSKHKSDKETDGKSSKHSSSRSSHHSSSSSSHHTSSSSSHSSKKHSSSSSSKSSSSSNKKTSSSSSSKRKEMLFDDLLNTPNKKLKTEKSKSHRDRNITKNSDSDDGGDSPMPDLSALDDIADDDWNQIISGEKSQKEDYSHLENLRSDESDEDELADLDDPRVMEECKQMFNEYAPPPGETIHHSKPKERKIPVESLNADIPAGKQRIARAPSTGSSSGNLIQKPVHRKPKMTPTQMMMERYKKLKEKAEELNKLVKTQEAQLKKQQDKNQPTDYPTKVESKHSGVSAAILNKPSGKPRIAHVPNVTGLLQARDKIKSLPPTNSRSLLSAQSSKASGSVPTHTAAMTSKGAKRVAHTPAPESLARPIVPVEFGSKVPQNVRQRYLNTFIDECLKFCDGQAEAFSKAMAEEKVCFNRATSRSIYLNLAVNTIKRLRMKQISEDAQELLENDPQYSQDNFDNQPSTSSGHSSKSKLSHPPSHKPSPMSHPTNPNLRSQSHFTTIATGGTKGSWSIEKVRRSNSEVERLRGAALYKHLKAYVLTEEDLESNGYPRPDPDEKGKAVIKVTAHRKKISPSSTERYCDRCNISFIVDKWGFPTSTEPCRHHWGRAYKKRGPGGLSSVYSCCSGDLTSEGCSIASTHVSQNFNPKELRGYVRTLPKSSKDGNYGIYALDCEMCYTTSGNELTRVTIIDSEGNMVYDTLVKPDNPIIDYNTRFSGITEEDMEDVTTTIREVQTSCLTRFSDRTILIGHSLESDLHALKIIHDTVIDTSVVFPHKMGPPYKRALRNLASELLKRIIQQDECGHDSKEDAVAAMDLMHWRVKEDLKVKQ